MDKKARNKKITSLAFGKDSKSYKEIGKMFDISPQRAYDIARREMLRNAKIIDAWAVLEYGELSKSPGSLMVYYVYPKEVLAEVKKVFSKSNERFRIVPCRIML